MVTDNVVAIKNGRLSLSRIIYHCDLQQASGLKIPLGVFAEITVDSLRGLGMIARTELSESEVGAIGSLARTRLLNPFEFLRAEFDWAWENTSAGAALKELANRSSESLFFAPPASSLIRRAFKADADATEFARRELRDRRDAEFDLMLAEVWGNAGPTGDMSKLVA